MKRHHSKMRKMFSQMIVNLESKMRKIFNQMIANLNEWLDKKIQKSKSYTKRRKMLHRIIVSPILILAGFWLFYKFSFPGYLPGELIIPWQTSPIWLFGFLILVLGLYILALPLIRRKVI